MATLMNCRLAARSALGSFSRVNTARLCNRQPLQAQRQLLLQPQHGTIKLTARPFSSISALRKGQTPDIPSGIPSPRIYTFEEVQSLTKSPSQNRILIDVREPSELLGTGRIPTAKSVPISSAPDAFFMSNEDFETKFGFPRPGEGDEVIFYCKAGVRSRQAALLAGQARPMFGGKIGSYNGSWLDWDSRGGKAEREGEQGEQSSVSGVTDPGQGRP